MYCIPCTGETTYKWLIIVLILLLILGVGLRIFLNKKNK
ncbi:MAG TPA: LPXTG cell wall anchor domain-containing protein [Clostridiaceae bacterium]|nr:LPXTG cell wall anchor domain-containing protein [Clostridiaceae bacterium]